MANRGDQKGPQRHGEAEKNRAKTRLAIDPDRGRADPVDHDLHGVADRGS